MSAITSSTEHQAVTRLFELARSGEVDNLEFAQLDTMIYERLQRTYDAEGACNLTESIS